MVLLMLAGCGIWLSPAKTVVFTGDSITQYWNLSDYFPEAPYTNRGIAGQTTSQILARFDADVVAARPETVVILAGTNDVLRFMSEKDAVANMQAMVAKAQAADIRVIVGTLPPVAADITVLGPQFANHDYNPEILSYNSALRGLGVPLVDYHTVLTGQDGLPLVGVLVDGVHPSPTGYAHMADLVGPMLR